MRRFLPQRFAAVLLLAASCALEEGTVDALPGMKDAGAPGAATDSGAPVVDAGTAGPDSGAPVVDAGQSLPDSGTPRVDAGTGGPDAGTPTLDVKWIHGSPSCAASTDPPLQVHRYDEDTFLLRQSKCVNYEGPFLYLLFGSQRAVLLDSGATADATRFPVRATVRKLVDDWAAAKGRAPPELVVMHSHAHGDHVAGDGQFAGQPGTTVVGTSVAAVQAFFQIQSWPTQQATFELGGRALTVIPLPGHEASHVAVHDPRTGWLLTGDSLYPGRLYVQNWAAYRASISRLVAFSQTRSITRVMGTHVEMTSTPRVDYPIGTTYQPMEHPLPLSLSHLLELDAALTRLGATPTREVHEDFIISP